VAPPSGQIRPGRYLASFVVIVAALYALVFFTGGQPTPKLGIDLQGGTRVTLTARTADGAEPTKEALNQARQIIETRVNGIGVSGAEVVLDGNNVIITVPGDEGEQAKSLGRTAKLGFRKVVSAVPAASAQQPQQPQQPAPGGQTPPTAPGAGQQQPPPTPQGRPAPAQPPTEPSAPGTSTAPSAPSAPAPSAAQDGSVDPAIAEEIQRAQAQRQSTDPQVQQQALTELDCAQRDPLIGNDDPTKPLVTCDQKGQEKYILDPVFLDGTEIDNASGSPDPQGVGFVVNLTFKSKGSATWAQFTTDNVQQRAAFVLDTEVVSAPTINEPIVGGNTTISGDFTQQEANELANVLKYGSLPLSFASSEAETVSATLGLASLEAGLIAGAIGLALVFLYCLFYYRALGVLTVLSLALSFALVYAVLVLFGRWLGYSLDLAGVAGFIVAIGITADSFVVFFERLKDEVREGRTFRSAVPRAWVRARRTILSADTVMFLAAAVLYALAVGQVRGFAFTLGMSTVLDLIVVFLVTHPLVAMASNSKVLNSPKLSGLGAVQALGASRRKSVGRTRAGAAVKEA
jgi:preprotein translocase subunit SecD